MRVIDGESVYEAFRPSSLELDVTIDFPHPLIGRQSRCVTRDGRTSFARELAPARTFGFVRRGRGAAREGSDQGRVDGERGRARRHGRSWSDALRWPDEFVRHKALDCVGDLALAGRARPRADRRAETESSRHGALVRERLVES